MLQEDDKEDKFAVLLVDDAAHVSVAGDAASWCKMQLKVSHCHHGHEIHL